MLPEGGGPSVSADRTGVAIGRRAMGKVLAARAFLTDTPAEVMQLPVQDVADSKEQMILRAVCDERISVPVKVPRGVQGPHGPHWRPGGPGGGEGQLALQHEAVVGRRSPPPSTASSATPTT